MLAQVNSLKLISFKEIIQHYKKQPQAKTDIFRTVVITQSDPELLVSKTGDIIEFYNAIFIPTVKVRPTRTLRHKPLDMHRATYIAQGNICSTLADSPACRSIQLRDIPTLQ